MSDQQCCAAVCTFTFMRHFTLLLLSTLLFLSCNNSRPPGTIVNSQSAKPSIDALRKKLTDYISTKKAEVGVAIMALEDADTLSINGHRHYRLMSVAKFPQALLLLHLVDQGKVNIGAPLHFTSADLSQRTGSSILKDHPQSSFDLSLPEALRYSIGQSDNITSNKIFVIEGGPQTVTSYIHNLGVTEINIIADYAHMGEDTLHRNWASPWAIAALLQKFYKDRPLSDSMHALLWKTMVEGTSGANRLKGELPAGTIVAHKTGTSGTDSSGITQATNDAGIVQLPNGKHFAIAVFVSDSKESDTANAAIISHICKEVWDYFNR